MTSPPAQKIAWLSHADAPEYAPLVEDRTADVAIIGAGYTGLSTALHLAELGLDVVVLEAEQPGWGASGRNAGAYLPPGMSKTPDQFKRRSGGDPKRTVNFVVEATRFLPRLIKSHQIQCDLRETGYLLAASSERSLESLAALAKSWNDVGADFDILDRQRLSPLVASEAYAGALLFKEAGSLNPLGYCHGLARAAEKAGANIFGASPVTDISPNHGGWAVQTGKASVRSHKILVATNAYIGNLWPGLSNSFIKLTMGMLGSTPFEDGGRTYLPGGIPLMDDSATDMFGAGFNAESRLICSQMPGTGAIDYCGLAQAYWKKFLRVFPDAPREIEWEYCWEGDVSFVPDQFPKVYKLAPGAYSATGYSGNGVATATLLGRDLARVIDSGDDTACSLPIDTMKKIPFSRALSWAVQTTGSLRHKLS